MEHEKPVDIDGLIATHQAEVWRYLRALGCKPALADDLTQETFLAVIRKPFQEINDRASAAYLRRVAYHLLLAYQKKSRRTVLTDDVALLDEKWERWAGKDSGNSTIDLMMDCFSRLTERAQLSLRLRFRENASRDRIAKALKISEHGAKNLMQRAKAQLKECMESRLIG